MASRIPNEVWMYIFELATTDDTQRDELPSCMDNSSWFRTVFGTWSLQSPEELSINAQKKRYKTIKAILFTCRNWHQIGGEFLYKSVSIFRQSGLQKLCTTFDRGSTLGWWTKRIYLGDSGVIKDDTLDILLSIIRHCPNIETMIVTWPLSSFFSAAIADTLLSFTSKSLHTLSWHTSCTALPKTIWALNSLSKSLQFLHLEFDDSDDENVHLGSAANLSLTLPNLVHISLRGAFQTFLEQCCEWSMPSLERVAFDFVRNRNDLPDVIEFLTHHGANLTFLDLNCLQSLDVAGILDLCPQLATFAFNPDWRLPSTDEFPPATKLVNRPHPNIKYIGLQHLMYAFGVGYAATFTQVDPFSTLYIRKSNDLNFAALTKRNFPSLQCVRVLSRALLGELEASNGPDKQCFPRWEKWWDQCVKQGVRLEDCTGSFLGTLPQDEPESDEEESSDGEEEENTDPYGTDKEPSGAGGVPISELRELLAECRRMSVVERDYTSVLDLEVQSGY